MPDIQYFHQIKKGDTVTLWSGSYRVQEDTGNLHVITKINGERKKRTITRDMFFEPGSKANWAINDWWKFYEYEEYLSFVKHELACLNIKL